MSGDEPYAGHNPVAVLLLALAGLIATPGLAIYAVVTLIRAAAKQTLGSLLKGAAVLAWVVTIGMYTWGVLHLLLLDESAQAAACTQVLGGPEKRSEVVIDRYETSFIPLHFGCHVKGGRTYEAAVPGYVNPVAGMSAVTAVALTAFAARSHIHYKERTA
ncbi:hypothetical protein [Streptomyces dysideae]|uniref:Uncharacterized protein n=1 Tax=Streptomyces dysideae TaxID=909626 RepID=A0A117S1Y4_9ACTN|nr:hypothetical protein [Streptomyces dysideae]KUO21857.1 hypothetical protein AQJ91_06900 [Streptomyces dysideae]